MPRRAEAEFVSRNWVARAQLSIDFGKNWGKKILGGRGSGRPSNHGLHVDKCSDFHLIDLAWLRKRKLANVGQWSTLRWSRSGRETGSIRLEFLEQGLRLVYRHRQDDHWISVDEVVPFVDMPLRLGGTRLWFKCLSCQRRCRILYGGGRFRCRLCHRLKYETQYEPAFARAATRALKIRERLGSNGGIADPFPQRPKGMHRRTYELLRQTEETLQAAWAQGIMTKFMGG